VIEGRRPPVALYVHVPFCVSVCPYCDFVVYGGSAARGPRNRIDELVRALVVELELRADGWARDEGPDGGAGATLRSIYLGGGTPSLLSPEQLGAILDTIRRRFGLAEDAEVTLEVNPGPDERGEARAWVAAGVNRLSIGAQSLEPDLLRRLGRRHRPEDVAATVAEARSAGIASVSLDLLYDVPAQSEAVWARTLEEALALEPDHLSIYALTLDDPDAEGLTGPGGDHLPTRSGARRWRDGARDTQDEDRAAAQYVHVVELLGGLGWNGYEISNWARPGHESRHNRAYWERLPYEAVGPGAHAFDGVTRRWNAARLDSYVAALLPTDGSAPRLPPGSRERIDPATAAAEAAILGLRTSAGLAAATGREEPLSRVVPWAVDAGLLTTTSDDRLVLTTHGRLLSNELFARLV
jgi:oxygen-independent coproporphyrinogen-3 oxidase